MTGCRGREKRSEALTTQTRLTTWLGVIVSLHKLLVFLVLISALLEFLCPFRQTPTLLLGLEKNTLLPCLTL